MLAAGKKELEHCNESCCFAITVVLVYKHSNADYRGHIATSRQRKSTQWQQLITDNRSLRQQQAKKDQNIAEAEYW